MAPSPTTPFDRNHLPPGVEPPSGTDPDTLGPYTVVGRIGAGGMGAVYAAVADDGTCSALKVVHPHFAHDAEFLARFGREVDLISRVRASCTPAFHGADLSSPTPWLATEYVPGPTLRGHLREKGALGGGMLLAVAVGLAEALAAIHAAGVVHRDLKPGNVIMSTDGPKVLDFGIARALDGTALTATGGLLGTPGWMAPEQYGHAEASPASDMFAWAALVYFAATGREPFGRGPVDVVSHRTRSGPPDLAEVPEEVRALVHAGLGADPARRPTAAQALEELTRTWTRTRVAGPDTATPDRGAAGVIAAEWTGVDVPAPRRSRRRIGLWPPLAAGVAVALLGAWFVTDAWRGGGAPDSGEGGDGADAETAAEEEAVEGPAIDEDPEQAQAVVAEAEEMLLAASSFETDYSLSFPEAGDPPSEAFAYTEDPEPIYRQSTMGGPAMSEIIEIGDGPDDVIRNTVMQTPDATDNFYRDPADEAYDTRRELWESRVEEFFAPVREEDGGTYLGVETVADPDIVELTYLEESGEEETREGHLYRFDLPPEQGSEDPEGTRTVHVWVDDNGFPQFIHQYEEWTEQSGNQEFSQFHRGQMHFRLVGEPVEIELPDEDQISDEVESPY